MEHLGLPVSGMPREIEDKPTTPLYRLLAPVGLMIGVLALTGIRANSADRAAVTILAEHVAGTPTSSLKQSVGGAAAAELKATTTVYYIFDVKPMTS